MDKRIIIIGGGPGGYVCALHAADLGANVTLIEKDNLGGTCLNWGCIPSKIMKNSAGHYTKLLNASKYGLSLNGDVSIDMSGLHENKNSIIAGQRSGIEALLKSRGVTTLFGTAKILDNKKVEITDKEGDTQTASYDKVVIATGTRPLNVKAFAFDRSHILSSDDLLSLEEVPSSLVIVGGGVIGCEFACIYAALGTQVTIVEAMSRLLPMPFVDEDISKTLLREMKKKKIKIVCDTVVESARVNDRKIDIQLAQSPITDNPKAKPPREVLISAEKMAVCIGRSPLSEGIGLETIGIELLHGGWIKADERMQTSLDDVYAIGDILGPDKVMLAHVASHEGMVAAQNAAGGNSEMNYEVIPGAVFTDPEIGVAGLSESQARETGMDAASASVNFRNIGKAHAIAEISGLAKIVYLKSDGRIIGAHIIGANATDLIAEATLAIQNELTLENVAHTIHAHPTLAEIWSEVCLKALGTPLHG